MRHRVTHTHRGRVDVAASAQMGVVAQVFQRVALLRQRVGRGVRDRAVHGHFRRLDFNQLALGGTFYNVADNRKTGAGAARVDHVLEARDVLVHHDLDAREA
ncbi:hypothetical protein H310_05744 [Aphanomyces invadans]|uniref:Uncharacterized protein n=1 Tax=Aphanomyces invadans TaxID=157072 RepID=A0A024U6X0_9STRA|nr:hypothetical protein H310_05744 [Aphanomyces invadans]ETW02176.1 hypothetical protein H310_05744 [Aphanomyces invadans]|eukprot:XP_008868781.1 hypothetical protein H310_05744 [Aphanomyces invadans]